MKKIFAILIACSALFAAGLVPNKAEAQVVRTFPLVAGDTLTDAGTVYKLITYTGKYDGVCVQVVLNRLSGTGAGTVTMQGSLDNTNWTTIGSAYTITNVAAQGPTFFITGPIPKYVRAKITGSGTESLQIRILDMIGKQ